MASHVAKVTNIRDRVKAKEAPPATWPAAPPLPDDSGTYHVECIMAVSGARPSEAAMMFAQVSTYAAEMGVMLTWKEKVTRE